MLGRIGTGLVESSPQEICGTYTLLAGEIKKMAEWQVLSMFGWLD